MQFLTLASNTSNNNIYFGDTDDPDIGMIRYAHADNSMQFRTNTAERLHIDSNGDVHMGNSGAPSFASIGSNNEGGLEIHNVGNDTAACLKLTGNNNSGGSPGQETYTQLEHRGANLTFNINHNGTKYPKLTELHSGSRLKVQGNTNAELN